MSGSSRPDRASARRSIVPLALRFLLVLLAAVVLVRVMAMQKADFEPAAPWGSPEPPPVSEAAETPPHAAATSFPAITARPLFFASRAPWQAPAPPKPPPIVKAPPTLTGYTAVGIIESGETRLVLIQPKSGNTIMLHEGQKLDGWTLKTITGDRLHFVTGSTSFDMTLPKPSGRGR